MLYMHPRCNLCHRVTCTGVDVYIVDSKSKDHKSTTKQLQLEGAAGCPPQNGSVGSVQRSSVPYIDDVLMPEGLW